MILPIQIKTGRGQVTDILKIVLNLFSPVNRVEVVAKNIYILINK